MDERTRNLVYALIFTAIFAAVLLLAYGLRDTDMGKFPHQIEKVRPGGVLPRKR